MLSNFDTLQYDEDKAHSCAVSETAQKWIQFKLFRKLIGTRVIQIDIYNKSKDLQKISI